MAYKYIMIKSGMWRFPVIFPDKFIHADIAELLLNSDCIPKSKDAPEPFVESAGEIIALDIEDVGGRSSSLHLNCHSDDTRIINTLPYLHGIGFKDD